jgi:hypothetical protein
MLRALCPRCLELEDELLELQQRLTAVGQYVTYSPGPNSNADLDRELRRWLMSIHALTPQTVFALVGHVWHAGFDHACATGRSVGGAPVARATVCALTSASYSGKSRV